RVHPVERAVNAEEVAAMVERHQCHDEAAQDVDRREPLTLGDGRCGVVAGRGGGAQGSPPNGALGAAAGKCRTATHEDGCIQRPSVPKGLPCSPGGQARSGEGSSPDGLIRLSIWKPRSSRRGPTPTKRLPTLRSAPPLNTH